MKKLSQLLVAILMVAGIGISSPVLAQASAVAGEIGRAHV